jgi:hypothetical protein
MDPYAYYCCRAKQCNCKSLHYRFGPEWYVTLLTVSLLTVTLLTVSHTTVSHSTNHSSGSSGSSTAQLLYAALYFALAVAVCTCQHAVVLLHQHKAPMC